jgi:ribosomal protein L21E
MKRLADFKVGDRVKLIAKSLAWRAEIKLQGKTGEVIERRDDGRISVRFAGGRLLMGRQATAFERVGDPGLKEKGK